MNATETIPAVFAGLPPIFKACAAEEKHGKYDCSQPFVIGEHVYASDGRIACRIKLSDVPDYVPTANKGPGADVVFAGVQTSGVAEIPNIEGPQKEPCDECHGDKEVECNYGHMHPCRECDRAGEQAVDPEPVFIDGHRLGGKYLWILKSHGITTISLPVVQLSKAPKVADKAKGGEYVYASHNGIEIVFVPMFQESE